MLFVRVLGSVDVVVGAERTAVSAAKERALLAILASQAGRPVALERLVEELWPQTRPANAQANLHVLLSRLRRNLAPAAAERLETVPSGYTLALAESELDEAVFLRSLGTGRDLVRSGEPAEAVRVLREGLGLWRGEPFLDVSTRTTDTEAARLRGARVNSLEALFEAELMLGHHAEVIVELDAAIDENPFHEYFWGMRMLALFRSGRQADALRSYRSLRKLTRDELGFDPTPELQRLELAMLEHDPELDWAGPGAALLPGAQQDRPGVSSPWSSIPAQPRLRSAGAREIMARAAELAVLSDVRVGDGLPGLRAAVVSGDAGVGKTRLIAQEALRAVEDGVAVIGGRCDEVQTAAYQPLAEIVEWILDSADQQVLGEVLAEDVLVQLRRLAGPGATGNVGGWPADASPVELYEAVAELVRAVTARGPLVLVLEDLHWLDPATTEMLRYLVRRLEAAPLVLLCSHRAEGSENAALEDFLRTLRRATDVREVALSDLTGDGVRELAADVLGRPVDPETATALLEETGGNPLFVVELLRHLVDIGAVENLRAQQVRTTAPPQSIRETIERRLSRLDADTQQVLAVGAVIGSDFHAGTVAAVRGQAPDATLAALDRAAAARLIDALVDSPGRYTFGHALIRRTVHDRIPVAERVRLHQRAAAAYESDGTGTAAQIALHYYEAAAAGSVGKAISTGIRAAEEARRALAYDDGVEILERTRRLVDAQGSVRERVEVLLALGDAHWWAGHVEESEAICGEAITVIEREKVVDGQLYARAVLGRWRNNGAGTQGFSAAAPDAELIEVIEKALVGLTEHPALRAALLGRLGIANYWTVPVERREEMADSAVALARAAGNEQVLLDVLVDRQFTLWTPESEERRLLRSAEVLGLARKLGQTAREADALSYQVVDHLALGDVRAADLSVRSYLRCAASLRQPFYRWHAHLIPALRAMMAGRFDEAEALTAGTVDEGETGAEGAELLIGLQTLWLFHERGRLAEIAPILDVVAGSFGEVPAINAARAWVFAEAGDHAGAQAMLTRLADDGFASFRADITWLTSMCLLASAAVEIEDAKAARVLQEVLEPYSGRNVLLWVGFCCGPVDYYLGRLSAFLGERDDASRYLDEAAALATSMQAAPLLLRIRLERCRVALASGQPSAGVAEELRAVHRDAEGLGMAGVAGIAAGMLD